MSYEQQVELGLADDVCLVCGMSLSGAPVNKVQHLGKDVMTCSPECLAEFYKNPEAFLQAEEEEAE